MKEEEKLVDEDGIPLPDDIQHYYVSLEKITELELKELCCKGGKGSRYTPILEKFIKSGWEYAVIETEDDYEKNRLANGLRSLVSNHQLPIRVKTRKSKVIFIRTGKIE